MKLWVFLLDFVQRVNKDTNAGFQRFTRICLVHWLCPKKEGGTIERVYYEGHVKIVRFINAYITEIFCIWISGEILHEIKLKLSVAREATNLPWLGISKQALGTVPENSKQFTIRTNRGILPKKNGWWVF